MQYRFETNCSKNKLKEIRVFVSEVLNNYSISEVDKNELVLAVDEVCANLIIHSHNCNETEHFDLIINVEKSFGITFEIIDKGVGFNLQKYQEPSIKEIIKKKQKGGVGLLLVKRIMDTIEFRHEAGGNTCRLFKKMNFRDN